MTRTEAHVLYHDLLEAAQSQAQTLQIMAELGRNDLFFLLVHILHRADADIDFVYDRCREVESDSDGYLDLWSREHYKSTIITFALTIQDILNDPEVTVGIFSFTRPIAKQFLKQIKREFEDNQLLKELYPDVLYQNPTHPKEGSPSWSMDNGITVKRRGNPKEATVEAWGLVDGQPTSKHFQTLVYDDVVSRESVTTPDQIAKTTEAWALSLNLGAQGGRRRYIGTRWHYSDTYKTIMERGSATARVYTATKEGTLEGEPYIWTKQELGEKYRSMGPYVAAAQLFQDPKMDSAQGFRDEWVRYWQGRTATNLSVYILVDAANEKKKENDYTVFAVIGLGADQNYYIIKWIRDRLNLTERANVLFKLHQEHRPVVVGYEQYGMMSDIHYMSERMSQTNYRFSIKKMAGRMPKNDRIRRLVPAFEDGRVWIPEDCWHVDYQNRNIDMTKEFLQEFRDFPYSEHDDMMDATSRIMDPDLGAAFPQPETANTSTDTDGEWNPLDF